MKKIWSKKIIFLLTISAVVILVYFLFQTENKVPKLPQTSLDPDIYMQGYFENEMKNNVAIMIDQGVVQGVHFQPKVKTSEQVVITFGGSEGGLAPRIATLLAENGVDTYAFYYFGQKNLNLKLEEVDISIFEDMFNYVKSEHPELEKVSIYGVSSGVALCLLLANTYPDKINKVVLKAPSSYLFGIKKSLFSLNGKAFNFLPEDNCPSSIIAYTRLERPMEYIKIRNGILENTENVEKYLIGTDKITAKLLILAGDDDKLWDSASMGQIIKDKLGEKAQLYIYPEAGHSFYLKEKRYSLALGGSKESNRAAMLDSHQKILDFVPKLQLQVGLCNKNVIFYYNAYIPSSSTSYSISGVS